jgi:hypothetical protein
MNSFLSSTARRHLSRASDHVVRVPGACHLLLVAGSKRSRSQSNGGGKGGSGGGTVAAAAAANAAEAGNGGGGGGAGSGAKRSRKGPSNRGDGSNVPLQEVGGRAGDRVGNHDSAHNRRKSLAGERVRK